MRGRRTGPFHIHTALIQAPCLHAAHNQGLQDQRILRYTDTKACLQCVAALARPRLQLDVHLIEPAFRSRFLNFWSQVGMAGPRACWPWEGYRGKDGRAQFAWIRSNIDSTRRNHWSPSRVAFWFSWGDIGTLAYRHTCSNPHCCNPLHLRALRVPHHPWAHRLDALDLALSSHKLREILAWEYQQGLEPDPTPHRAVVAGAPQVTYQRFLQSLSDSGPD